MSAEPRRADTPRAHSVLGVAVLVTTSVIALAGASAFSIYRLHRHAVNDATMELRRTATVLGIELLNLPGGVKDEEFVRHKVAALAATSEARLTVIALDGRPVADSDVPLSTLGNLSERPDVRGARVRSYGAVERVEPGGDRPMLHVTVPIREGGRPAWFASASRPTAPISSAVLLATPMLAYLAVAAIAIVVVGRMAMHRVGREAQRLIDVAQASASRLVESERALRTTDERFQLAARASNDVLWDWDLTSGEIWWSEGVRTVFGYGQGPSTLQGWIDLVHLDDIESIVRSLQEFMESSRETWSGEYRFRRADGRFAWVLDRGIVVRSHEGKPLRIIGSMMDMTERKEAERHKSDFVSFVSHQLRTPLSGMNWMLELAADAENLPDEARQNITAARESAARLVGLVNDLLDIARLESGRTTLSREPVRLDDVTDSVLRELQTLIDEKRHVVRFERDGAPPVVGDPQMIRQVVANLLSNAIKYTPAGGRIDVELMPSEKRVQWQVRDNGMGVPRAAQGRLFEKFFRADNAISAESEGTGLGLHLVRLVIENAGGQVWCDSEEGHGATFAFTLPVAQHGEWAS